MEKILQKYSNPVPTKAKEQLPCTGCSSMAGRPVLVDGGQTERQETAQWTSEVSKPHQGYDLELG